MIPKMILKMVLKIHNLQDCPQDNNSQEDSDDSQSDQMDVNEKEEDLEMFQNFRIEF